MIIKIAICDDENFYIRKVKEVITSIISRYKEGYEINEFHSGEELINCYKKNGNRCDVVLLDIDMPGMNGIETAKKIREKDEEVLIVFLTGHEEYIKIGYQVRAFRYVSKGVEEELKEAIEGIRKKLRNKRKILLQDVEGKSYVFSEKEIIYAETEERRIRIYALGETFLVNHTLLEMHDILGKDNFYSPHRAYLVNLEHVAKYSGKDIYMDNGSKVMLSKRRCGEFKKFYLEWKFERGNG